MILSLLSMAIVLCFQTKLHDGVCQKRQAATIATHDLMSVKYGYYFVQTKLHDGVCQKRQAATIATHDLKSLFVCFCCFTSHVNSYGHCGIVSSLTHTFSWAGLSKRLTSNLCTYFRL